MKEVGAGTVDFVVCANEVCVSLLHVINRNVLPQGVEHVVYHVRLKRAVRLWNTTFRGRSIPVRSIPVLYPSDPRARPSFLVPFAPTKKALVIHDEISRFRRDLHLRQKASTANIAGGRSGGWDGMQASTSLMPPLAGAPAFEEPVWTKGGDSVPLQRVSQVGSKAIAALRKRDEVSYVVHPSLKTPFSFSAT